jgi:hypothetical protein
LATISQKKYKLEQVIVKNRKRESYEEEEEEEEDNWYSLNQVPTTSHLVKTSTQAMIIWEIWAIWDEKKPIRPNLRLVGTL